MEQSLKKFLEFNGKKIYFKSADGQYWIAIKPICESLGVNYNRQFQNLKQNKILSQVFAIQQIVAADGKLREMVCLPEFFIYGWIFKIESDSPGLEEYQWKCFRILYDYFHGSITEMLNHIKEKTKAEKELEDVEKKLKESDLYKKKEALLQKIKEENKAARKANQEFVSSQLNLWETQEAETENADSEPQLKNAY